MKLRNAIALGAALAIAFVCTPILMAARNSGGTYSLPSGNPVVSGTTISSTWANNTLLDVSTEITNSLDRSGRGAMLAPLQLYAGSSSAPGVSFSAESNSGLYRAASNDLRMQVNATTVEKWTPANVAVTGTLTATASGNNNGLVGTGTHGIVAYSTAYEGVYAYGDGGSAGVYGIGGPVSGPGVAGLGGTPNGIGGDFAGVGTGVAVRVGAGNASFTASNPASTTGFSNTLTPKNIPKAWGRTAGGTTQAIVGGFNVASASCATSKVTVTFGTAMSDANYSVIVSKVTGGTQCAPELFTTSASAFVVACRDSASVLVDMCSSGNAPFSFVVFGAQ